MSDPISFALGFASGALAVWLALRRTPEPPALGPVAREILSGLDGPVHISQHKMGFDKVLLANGYYISNVNGKIVSIPDVDLEAHEHKAIIAKLTIRVAAQTASELAPLVNLGKD